jgi:hypothetical protein
MKNSFKFLSIAFLVLMSLGILSCNKEADDEIILVVELTSEEASNLLFMREEEKLVRDVYVFLFEKYNMSIFENISGSEQKHMDFVLDIMNEYGYEDNAAAAYGEFNNSELQDLYNDLIAKGSVSLYDALVVGATIEDVDIYDLNTAIDETDKSDIVDLYSLLLCGSKNHIRAFTDHLSKEGPDYVPQFIDQGEFNAILAASQEPCR